MHDVKALIASASILTEVAARFGSAVLCPLVQGFALLPLTDIVVREIATAEKTSETETSVMADIAPGVAPLAYRLSLKGPVAYISTEFFGGTGGQDAVVWTHAAVAFQLTDGGEVDNIGWPNSPVSQALRSIGVIAAPSQDEFDTVGLGRHRSTSGWADAYATA